jgi:2-methylisocitrate lyase-like PEP mutase family enzyme
MSQFGQPARDDDGGGLRTIEDQCERIAAARTAADEAGIRLFLNARTDTYLRAVGDPANRLQDTLIRADAYRDAGAYGIFVPGTADRLVIGELAGKLGLPLNILAGPGAPTVAELTRLGVARISLGSAVAQAAYGLVRRAAAELLDAGEYAGLDSCIDYSELNALL